MAIQIISVAGSIVLAIVSALIPLFQSLLNKKSEERKIKIENLYKSKLAAYQDLMVAFGHYRKSYLGYVDEFLSCLCKAMLFCNDDLKAQINLVIDELSLDENHKQAYNHFESIIHLFSWEIESIQNELLLLNKTGSKRKNKTQKSKDNSTKHE